VRTKRHSDRTTEGRNPLTKTTIRRLLQTQRPHQRPRRKVLSPPRRQTKILKRAKVLINLSRLKADIDKKNIIDLRTEIDQLRVQLQKANLLIEELLRSNTNLKRQTDTRSN
jgi:hypothetical protein